MSSCALFPLTPALSLRERGNRIQSHDKSGPFDLARTGRSPLPLPEGEGWGEGERSVDPPQLCALILSSREPISYDRP
jgi:hypothetical protein